MKLTNSLFIAFGLSSAVLLLPVAARAQADSPAPAATPSVSAPAPSNDTSADKHAGRHEKMKERMAALTPEERERVKSAHEKAMQDPAVKAAEGEKKTDHHAYQKAVHEAMLRADPTIGPVLEKLHPAHHHGEAEDNE